MAKNATRRTLDERDPLRYVACEIISSANVELIHARSNLIRAMNRQIGGLFEEEFAELKLIERELFDISQRLTHLAHGMRHS